MMINIYMAPAAAIQQKKYQQRSEKQENKKDNNKTPELPQK